MPNWVSRGFPNSPIYQHHDFDDHRSFRLPTWPPSIPDDIIASQTNQYSHSFTQQVSQDKNNLRAKDIYQGIDNPNVPLPECTYFQQKEVPSGNGSHAIQTKSKQKTSLSTNHAFPSLPLSSFNDPSLAYSIEPNFSTLKRRKLSINSEPLLEAVDMTQETTKYSGNRRRKANIYSSKSKENDAATIQSTEHGGSTQQTTRREARSTKSEASTVNQIENELAFLKDECATILINLDSLRNAFHADAPSIPTSYTSNSSMATINFVLDKKSNNNDELNIKKKARLLVQNPEIEREIRIAYDDLMIQVRQVEKKVELLEAKSKKITNTP
ncbi:hypothetical protein A0J61_07215 [Choanephora cucurbitarum]|uniref:Uncharacterized protein n=1 Tax=Choanephora cucurbitarum TaxID=101091 RepID=A0A1C7N7Y7_9FUNG|nr:hypothetical protein A0J61_07215 [Choanephora cucurbitarum]